MNTYRTLILSFLLTLLSARCFAGLEIEKELENALEKGHAYISRKKSEPKKPTFDTENVHSLNVCRMEEEDKVFESIRTSLHSKTDLKMLRKLLEDTITTALCRIEILTNILNENKDGFEYSYCFLKEIKIIWTNINLLCSEKIAIIDKQEKPSAPRILSENQFSQSQKASRRTGPEKKRSLSQKLIHNILVFPDDSEVKDKGKEKANPLAGSANKLEQVIPSNGNSFIPNGPDDLEAYHKSKQHRRISRKKNHHTLREQKVPLTPMYGSTEDLYETQASHQNQKGNNKAANLHERPVMVIYGSTKELYEATPSHQDQKDEGRFENNNGEKPALPQIPVRRDLVNGKPPVDLGKPPPAPLRRDLVNQKPPMDLKERPPAPLRMDLKNKMIEPPALSA